MALGDVGFGIEIAQLPFLMHIHSLHSPIYCMGQETHAMNADICIHRTEPKLVVADEYRLELPLMMLSINL